MGEFADSMIPAPLAQSGRVGRKMLGLPDRFNLAFQLSGNLCHQVSVIRGHNGFPGLQVFITQLNVFIRMLAENIQGIGWKLQIIQGIRDLDGLKIGYPDTTIRLAGHPVNDSPVGDICLQGNLKPVFQHQGSTAVSREHSLKKGIQEVQPFQEIIFKTFLHPDNFHLVKFRDIPALFINCSHSGQIRFTLLQSFGIGPIQNFMNTGPHMPFNGYKSLLYPFEIFEFKGFGTGFKGRYRRITEIHLVSGLSLNNSGNYKQLNPSVFGPAPLGVVVGNRFVFPVSSRC